MFDFVGVWYLWCGFCWFVFECFVVGVVVGGDLFVGDLGWVFCFVGGDCVVGGDFGVGGMGKFDVGWGYYYVDGVFGFGDFVDDWWFVVGYWWCGLEFWSGGGGDFYYYFNFVVFVVVVVVFVVV